MPFPGLTNDPFEGRGAQTVDLRRISALSPSGIYRCDIAFDSDARETFYVGVYNNGGTIVVCFSSLVPCVKNYTISHSCR